MLLNNKLNENEIRSRELDLPLNEVSFLQRFGKISVCTSSS